MLSRRGLILAGSAATVCGMIGNKPLLAVAKEEDRYDIILRQATGLVEDAQKFQGIPGYKDLPAFGEWYVRADELLNNLMNLFPEEPDTQMVHDLLEGNLVIPAMDEARLREVVPGIVPIAMMREMILTRHMPFRMCGHKKFPEFAERHRRHVLRQPW